MIQAPVRLSPRHISPIAVPSGVPHCPKSNVATGQSDHLGQLQPFAQRDTCHAAREHAEYDEHGADPDEGHCPQRATEKRPGRDMHKTGPLRLESMLEDPQSAQRNRVRPPQEL